MQIFIRNMDDGKTITCEVESSDNVKTIKDFIQTTPGFEKSEQRVLMYGGKQLEEGGEYGIEKDATLELVAGLERGAFGIEEEAIC